MELSKAVAVTAILFVIVLILTSGRSLGQNPPRPGAPAKPNEATFQRSGPSAARPAGTEYAPARKRQPAASSPCLIKAVMTEADIAACRAVKRR